MAPPTGRTGGDLLARTLKRAGVDKVFALHGGHLEAFYKGCLDHDLDLIDFRHESAAGHAADAYARATGRLGVCVITAGPGFTNALSAMVNAQLDGSPTLFIVGAPPLREVETNPLQGGFDQVAMAAPGVKWAHRITNTERIPDLTALAIRRARTGRRGAVLLELPIDVLHAVADPKSTTDPTGLAISPCPAPSPDEVDALVALLAMAERPAIIVGGEARFSECGRALAAFAERSGVPVLANSRGLGLLPMDSSYWGGGASVLAMLPMVKASPPDAVLLLGARTGLFLGGRGGSIIPAAARLGHVYSDTAEIGRLREVDVGVSADCAMTLEAMLERSRATVWRDLSTWRAALAAARSVPDHLYPTPQGPGGIHPKHAVAAALAECGPTGAYAFDGGEAASWATDAVQVDGPGRVLSHGYLGCLGIGPGFAIGLQTAFPDRRVVHVTGDGAMGFHIQEFDTMVRHNLPIVTVVLNNRVWGMSIHGQQIMFGPNYNVITQLGDTHYADVAAAFGCLGQRVTELAEIAPAMRRALASRRPACIEILTDPDVIHPVTLSMLGKPIEGSGEVIIPYYENLPAHG